MIAYTVIIGLIMRINLKSTDILFLHQLTGCFPVPACTKPIDSMSRLSTSMTRVACESKLYTVLRLYMHPCPGNHVTIGCVVVYYAWDAHAFSADACPHCRL